MYVLFEYINIFDIYSASKMMNLVSHLNNYKCRILILIIEGKIEMCKFKRKLADSKIFGTVVLKFQNITFVSFGIPANAPS